MTGYLYSAFGGALAAWAITRFAVAKGWYLAHKVQIASTVAEAKAMATMADKDARSISSGVQQATQKK